MKVSIIMPSYLRPECTKRAIDCILAQTETDWEAFVVGDNCPVIQNIIDNREYNNESRLKIENLTENHGGYGYFIRNTYKHRASGKYIVYLDNDDVILPEHLENYLSGIENTDYDFVFFNTLIHNVMVRDAQLENGKIGHSELIIRTSFLKSIEPVSALYGHDWELVKKMIDKGAKYSKAVSSKTTYYIMGFGNNRIDSNR
jgi:glycosyltransferase involved in cell wall biosynthesis